MFSSVSGIFAPLGSQSSFTANNYSYRHHHQAAFETPGKSIASASTVNVTAAEVQAYQDAMRKLKGM
jgi:hypothetical protein